MESTLTALADPRRRTIVELLRGGDQPVQAIVAALPIAQSGVSRHLRILKEAGLVTVRAQGQQRIYGLRREPFDELAYWLDDIRRIWEGRLDRLEAELVRRQAVRDESEEDE